MENEKINIRNMYIELLNKLKGVEGVDIHYIDQMVQLLEHDIDLIEIPVNWILSVIPSGTTTEDPLVKSSQVPAAQSTYITEEFTLQGPWYGPQSGLYYWDIFINDRIDDTKNWIINLIPGNSSDIAPTAAEASMYNALKGVTVVQDSTNQIKLTLYSTIDPTSAYKIQFSYWSLP